MTCPACSATDRQEPLGNLGSKGYIKCRFCGWVYLTTDDPTEPCYFHDHGDADECARCQDEGEI